MLLKRSGSFSFRFLTVCCFIFIYSFLYSQEPSYWPTDGWKTSTPEEQGMDSKILADGVNKIAKGSFFKKPVNLHSLLVIRNGYIIVDAYTHSFAPDTKHDLASVTKSITSTLIGAAIEKGYIENVHQTVLSFYPDRIIRNNNADKKAMTIDDLLTMRSGFKNVWIPGDSTFFKMINSSDWVQFVLDLPMVSKPGTAWEYNSASMQLLSDIIHKTTSKNALTFAEEALFGPLGISDVAWPSDYEGINNLGSCCLRMRPHDLAKIGYLYLYNGIWDGKKILPNSWVEEATKRHEFLENSLLGTTGYGYLWWLLDGGFRAEGRGAQHLYVFPELELIVVTTGGIWENKAWEIVKQFVLPAVKSDKPLPENDKSCKKLQIAIEKASYGKMKSVKSSKPSALEEKISGKKIILEPNLFNIKYMTLLFGKKEKAEFTLGMTFDCDENGPPTYMIGLDGKPCTSNGRFGLPTIASGRWLSRNTFVINLNEIGNINTFVIKMKFDDNQMTGQIEEKMTGLGTIELSGHIR